MTTPIEPTPAYPDLDRGIDRFLRADGWHVTAVDHTGAGVAVTLTKAIAPHLGATVTRTAAGVGEATLKACSSARRLETPAVAT